MRGECEVPTITRKPLGGVPGLLRAVALAVGIGHDPCPRAWRGPGRGRREPQASAGGDAPGVRVDEAAVRAPYARPERPDQAAGGAALGADRARPGPGFAS